MICAYDKVYLEKARKALGRMLDYAVYDMKYDIDEFWKMFIASEVAERFGEGDYSLLVGKSGVEIAREVIYKVTGDTKKVLPKYTANRSAEYWAGWALAYFQWESSLKFIEITSIIPIKYIIALYSPYHEMDIRNFCDKIKELYKEGKPDTNLKILRRKAGFTQKELADQSNVPLRTVQQYEQRQKDINKAQGIYICSLAKILNCDAIDLLEKI